MSRVTEVNETMFKIMYMSKVLFWSTAHINSHFIQKIQ